MSTLRKIKNGRRNFNNPWYFPNKQFSSHLKPLIFKTHKFSRKFSISHHKIHETQAPSTWMFTFQHNHHHHNTKCIYLHFHSTIENNKHEWGNDDFEMQLHVLNNISRDKSERFKMIRLMNVIFLWKISSPNGILISHRVWAVTK